MQVDVTPRKKNSWLIVAMICFAFIGWHVALTIGNNSSINKHQTLSAATLSDYQIQTLPYDLRVKFGERVQKVDTVKIHDTTFVDRPQVVVINKKSRTVRAPKGITDYVYLWRSAPKDITVTSNAQIPDREEKTGEVASVSPKETSIQLVVNGDTVYSKDVTHSTGEP